MILLNFIIFKQNVSNFTKMASVFGFVTLYSNEKSLGRCFCVASNDKVDISKTNDEGVAEVIYSINFAEPVCFDEKNDEHLWFIIEHNGEKLKFAFENNSTYLMWQSTFSTKHVVHNTMTIEDFEMVSVIGQGSCGKVRLAKVRGTNELVAIKSMRKKTLLDNDHLRYALHEMDVLSKMDCPFIVKLYYAFQSPSKLFLVMEYAPGGNLHSRMVECGRLSKAEIKFYVAEIAWALHKLHEENIIYRDLKPENVVLTELGHIKFTDFGLAYRLKTKDSRMSSFSGTPEYLAPEVIENKPYGQAVDWWSLGILLYEMLYKITPFSSKNQCVLYNKILSKDPVFPNESSSVVSLVEGLLCKDPEKRYRFEDVKNHSFLKDIDFEKIFKREVDPPFTPCIPTSDSVGNFDKYITSLPKDESPDDASPQFQFQGFYYSSSEFMSRYKNNTKIAVD